jgi:hypothetical protein
MRRTSDPSSAIDNGYRDGRNNGDERALGVSDRPARKTVSLSNGTRLAFTDADQFNTGPNNVAFRLGIAYFLQSLE